MQGNRAHIIGMCGVGMSATGLLLKEAGWEVTGSDAGCYGPPKDILDRAGLSLSVGYSPDNIPPDVDLFVIGRSAKLSPEENAEVRAAHASGKKILSFAEVLGELTQNRHNVVVAGSYGKSSTSSLLAHVLRHAGVDAGYFIGAEPTRSSTLPFPSQLGSAELFVLEGDEYPSAHDDTRAKFLHLHPTDILLTSVVHDHVNVYPTFEDYKKPFAELLALIPENGTLVACADEPNAHALAAAARKTLVTYGVETGTYHAEHIRVGERTRFTLMKDSETIIEIETGELGRHAIENIVGVCTYVLSRELIPPEALRDAVADFKGVRRRLDSIAPSSSVPVYEGFGSSYEKARAAIEAIRLHFPSRSLVIVFEPHTFGWRNRANLSWYDTVFEGASRVFIAPPETQGSATHDQLSSDDILERVRSTQLETLPYDPAHTESVAAVLGENDIVLILTSGDLEGSLVALVRAIEARFPVA